MTNGNATIIVGSAWRRSITPFFQRIKSYFIQFITNQLPETGRIMPWLRLFAFAGRMVVYVEGLTTTGNSILSG